MQYSHSSILITHRGDYIFVSTFKKKALKWTGSILIELQFYRERAKKNNTFVFPFIIYQKLKVGPSLFCSRVEWDVWHFVLGLTVVLYIYIMLYIAFWAIAACLWVPTLSKRFPFSVSISWWIHSCFCLMNANSCNMQELWPLNKITVHVYRLLHCSLTAHPMT